jgi:hypothetical protein
MYCYFCACYMSFLVSLVVFVYCFALCEATGNVRQFYLIVYYYRVDPSYLACAIFERSEGSVLSWNPFVVPLMPQTERCGRVGSTDASCILREVSRDFRKFIQASSGILPQIRPRQLPSTYFPIHHSLISCRSVLYNPRY